MRSLKIKIVNLFVLMTVLFSVFFTGIQVPVAIKAVSNSDNTYINFRTPVCAGCGYDYSKDPVAPPVAELRYFGPNGDDYLHIHKATGYKVHSEMGEDGAWKPYKVLDHWKAAEYENAPPGYQEVAAPARTGPDADVGDNTDMWGMRQVPPPPHAAGDTYYSYDGVYFAVYEKVKPPVPEKGSVFIQYVDRGSGNQIWKKTDVDVTVGQPYTHKADLSVDGVYVLDDVAEKTIPSIAALPTQNELTFFYKAGTPKGKLIIEYRKKSDNSLLETITKTDLASGPYPHTAPAKHSGLFLVTPNPQTANITVD